MLDSYIFVMSATNASPCLRTSRFRIVASASRRSACAFSVSLQPRSRRRGKEHPFPFCLEQTPQLVHHGRRMAHCPHRSIHGLVDVIVDSEVDQLEQRLIGIPDGPSQFSVVWTIPTMGSQGHVPKLVIQGTPRQKIRPRSPQTQGLSKELESMSAPYSLLGLEQTHLCWSWV